MSAAVKVAQALASLRDGRAAQAEALCTDVLRHQPRHAEALHLLGIAVMQRGNPAAGIGYLRASAEADPNNALTHCNLGNALCEVQAHDTALDCYRRSLQLAPGFAGTHYSLGNALLELQRPAEALASFERAVALRPGFAEAHNNRGKALLQLGDPQRALESFRRAVRERPQFALAIGNCAQVLCDLNQPAAALEHYEQLATLLPPDAAALRNRGHCLLQLERTAEALSSYEASLALKADDAQTLYGRGLAWRRMRRHAPALADFERALELAPESMDIRYRLAEALRDLRRYAEAAEQFHSVLMAAPHHDFALGNLIHARLQNCDWRDYAANVAAALQAVAAGRRVYLPGAFLSIADSAQAQFQCAQLCAPPRPAGAAAPLWNGEVYAHPKIRVAYVSADFREHPVSALLVGVLEQHDRGRFEVIGVALAPEQASDLGQRIKHAFDRFLDVSGHTDRDVAVLLRELQVDITVDLMGLTGGARTGIFAHRPAPVQVSYLGYTGTTASPDLDYLIADEVVIPEAQRRFYREKIVYLPHSYQPSDNRRAIAPTTPTRAACGLPQHGFVFCCFNTHYKISPPVFAVWMQILRAVPGSVLWLSGGSPEAVTNLRRASLELEVAPERLVFAERVAAPEEHLARYRLADLFLDTSPFNAHATANEALWAGLPVLTCRGGSFVGRVAASLLSAVGLPELITDTPDAYRAQALNLATTPALLAQLRARLVSNRATHALFDTARYTQHLERAFRLMLTQRLRGEAECISICDTPV